MDFSASTGQPTTNNSNRAGLLLWLGLFGAPGAWVAQLLLSEPVAAYACYPFQEPLPGPILSQLMWILGWISVVCLLLGLLSGASAWQAWRRLQPSGKQGQDRNRFLAKLALLASFIFIVAIVFNIFAVFLVPPCTPWL
ncbi:MAG: hypothetical protein ACXWF8_11655 [Methylobacter sp.]